MKNNMIIKKFGVHTLAGALAACMVLMLAGCGTSTSSTASASAASASGVTTAAASASGTTAATQSAYITFPCQVDEGKITVDSMFQSTMINPDCDNKDGDDLASLEIVNNSGEYLKSATFTAETSDGSSFTFKVEDLPAGKTAWIFDVDNKSVSTNPKCTKIACASVYSTEEAMNNKNIAVTTNGTKAIIKNLSGSEQKNLTVSFHCLFEGIYLGGITYNYDIASIAAGDSTAVDVQECLMGSAEAVSVIQK